MTLVEFLATHFGLDVILRRTDAVLVTVILAAPDGRRFLLIERTYRAGVCVLEEPRPEEVECAEKGDLWALWNSDRAVLLAGII